MGCLDCCCECFTDVSWDLFCRKKSCFKNSCCFAIAGNLMKDVFFQGHIDRATFKRATKRSCTDVLFLILLILFMAGTVSSLRCDKFANT